MQFTKKLVTRLVVTALCVIVTQVAVRQLQHSNVVLASAGARFDVEAIPRQIGPWLGEQEEHEQQLFIHVGARSMANRAYRNEIGRVAFVHLAAFATENIALPHTPQECYLGTGWAIVKDEWQDAGDSRRFRQMRVQRGDEVADIIYWYQIGADVAAEPNDLRKILQKLRRQGSAWPPTVKVLIQFPIGSTEDDIKTAAEQLAAGIYDSIKENS